MNEDRGRLRKARAVKEGTTSEYIIYDDGILSVKVIDFEKSSDEMYSYSLEIFNRSWLSQLRELTFTSEVMDGRYIREQKIVQWLKRRERKFIILIGIGGPIKFMSIDYWKHSLLINFFKWLGENFKYILKSFD